MARPLRVEYPGALYHVINRGNAGENLFRDNRDREKFLEYLQTAIERFSLRICTYCLMTNHFHILLETPLPNLSQAIQWVNVSYAGYFNRKYERHGHLFQGRFKSILVDADEYLKQLSRYIHLNPVRAGLVEHPAEYEWSSYATVIGKTGDPEWLDSIWLLSQFGTKKKQAIANYKNFVEEADNSDLKDPARDLYGGFILGSPDFVIWIKEAFLAHRSDEAEIPQLRDLKPRISLDNIVNVVCREFNCKRETIFIKGRKGNVPRDVAIYLARVLSGEKGKKMGVYFGNISGAAITGRYNYLLRQIENNKRFGNRIKRLKNKLLNN
ncbi:MAG: transposase [Desulfobacterales bacterium]|jgi:REP element-mobilizing transposase RayT